MDTEKKMTGQDVVRAMISFSQGLNYKQVAEDFGITSKRAKALILDGCRRFNTARKRTEHEGLMRYFSLKGLQSSIYDLELKDGDDLPAEDPMNDPMF